MRYFLTNLIENLTKEEIRNFKIFNSRFKYQGEAKKVIRLFDLIKNKKADEYEDKLVEQFYPNKSKNAFYRLKNRLVGDIEGSIVQLNQRRDDESDVYYLLVLANSFFRKSDFQRVSYYLKKAEKIASNSNRYDLLSIIYGKFVRLAKHLSTFELEEYLEKSRQNLLIQCQTQKNSLLISAVTHKLRRTNFSGKNETLIETLNEVITNLEIDSETLKAPILKLQLHQCVRGILLEKKDFVTLSDYLLKSYHEFERDGLFTKEFHEEKLILLSWIVNALPRSGKFELIADFIVEMENAMQVFEKRNNDNYTWLLYQTKVIYFTFSQQLPSAMKLLKELEVHPKLKNIPHYTILIYLNLTVLNFYDNNLQEALSYLSKIILDPSFNKQESTWKMNITLVEIMIRVDSKDHTYAINKCNEFLRKFKGDLRNEHFKREKEFLRILKTMASKARAISDPKFSKKVQEFIADSPDYEPGSNEAINYKLWLIAKQKRKDYYSIMLKHFSQL